MTAMQDAPLSQFAIDRELSPRLRWHCEPKQWSIDPVASALRIRTDPGTDFWQRTHYAFEADNGHFLLVSMLVESIRRVRT
jgi:regulation of enolase protein 1 (concanavalin A-like superfamily)